MAFLFSVCNKKYDYLVSVLLSGLAETLLLVTGPLPRTFKIASPSLSKAATTMDAIKKKMTSLASETAIAEARAVKFEEEAKSASEIADRTEEQVRTLQKKLQAIEGKYDTTLENLLSAESKLEEKEKVLSNAEADVANLSRKILLVEDEVCRIYFWCWDK